MRVFLFVLPLALAACSASSPATAVHRDVAVAGTLTAVDLDPWAYDGDGVLTLETADGEAVTVLVPARITLCAAEGLGAVGELAVGDGVEVVGAAEAGGAVRPCAREAHRVVRVGPRAPRRATPPEPMPAGPGTFRGAYLYGFEASLFRPCDSQETWWLRPNGAFAEALRPIAEAHLDRDALGDRIVVEATVEGTLSPVREGGGYGHMGAFERELTVTGLEAMTFVSADASAPLACP